MLVREYYATRNDGVKLYKTYSDLGNYIKQLPTECIYDIAIDVEYTSYIYVETDEKIVEKEPQEV